ncbi:hypothetical protein T484DRAFT_1753220 [Baffinella frigidus]|nr:hypothetical protein T484DRAFT_1753220 [Cryptophyta sp. CCMP2293]
MKRGQSLLLLLLLILATLTPVCIATVHLRPNSGLSAPPSKQNIAETAASGYKPWRVVLPARFRSLRGGSDFSPAPREPHTRVIERETSFSPICVHLKRGHVLFPSDGSFKAFRPDFPWGLTLVGSEDEIEDGAEIGRLVGGTRWNNNHTNVGVDEGAEQCR